MKKIRKSFVVVSDMAKRMKKLSEDKDISEAEVLRRYFIIADNIMRELERGREIYSEKEGADRAKLVMPF